MNADDTNPWTSRYSRTAGLGAGAMDEETCCQTMSFGSRQVHFCDRNVLRRTNWRLDPRFPGSQPVSFGKKDIEKLESLEYVAPLFRLTWPFTATSSYWVCEKSDGIRVLFLIQTDLKDQMVFIVCPKLLHVPHSWMTMGVGRLTVTILIAN